MNFDSTHTTINNIINTKIKCYKEHHIDMTTLGILAGIYISLGALLMSVAKANGCNVIVCGLLFSVGLISIVLGGGELFTGNCLLKAFADSEQQETIVRILINNYLSNFIGCLWVFVIVLLCGIDTTVLSDIATTKCSIPAYQLIARGFACNICVCLAIWMSNYTNRNDIGITKILCITIPIIIFVACGFEHCIANMFFLPFGLLYGKITIVQVSIQLFSVTIGNVIGGVFIGAHYDIVFGKGYHDNN